MIWNTFWYIYVKKKFVIFVPFYVLHIFLFCEEIEMETITDINFGVYVRKFSPPFKSLKSERI